MTAEQPKGVTVEFADIAKRFGDVRALEATDLTIAAGEFLRLLGPSGSGKTTLLNITAGYLQPSAGCVRLGGRDVTELPARRRNIGMVFQNYALFPHQSVAGNVGYGLKVRRRPRDEIQRRVSEALEMVQLGGMENRRIQELSGGQQQRVALARALVIDPDVLLMDEPLGALDRQLRKTVQLEIRRLHVAHRRTTIYVTHDQEEALVMSDRVGVMREGRLVQLGTPRELYDSPVDTFVAGFLGESNLLYGRVEQADRDECVLAVDGVDRLAGPATAGLSAGARAAALIRPEHVHVGESGRVSAHIREVVFLGELLALRAELANGDTIWCRRFAKDGVPGDGEVRLDWAPEDVRILPDANARDREA
jgi:ABC-type Fe3+/spermidine/putrescine transport system ATPase subunit